MFQHFKKSIQNENLFTHNDKLIVAVSGGVDSIVLLDLLTQLQQPIIVAHCNFQLRGDDSHLDEKFVATFCKERSIPIEIKTFETKSLKSGSSLSIQMLARELRYNWFEELRNKHQAAYIVTAHHQQDVLETILINLTRGTGIKGLHGIRPSVNFIRRPLLPFTKEEIIHHASSHQLKWREDKSNATNDYFRNHIRNEIVPILKKYNPHVEEAFHSTSNILFEYEKLAQSLSEELKSKYIQQQSNKLYISYQIRSYKNGLPILFHWLSPYGFTWEQTKSIYTEDIKQSGKTLYSSSHRLIYNRDEWIIDIYETNLINIDFKLDALPKLLSTNLGDISFVKSSLIEFVNRTNQPNEIYVDGNLFNCQLNISNWNNGDRIQPLGMHTSKKISDVLIDKKIALNQKASVLALKQDAEILWLIGIQSSDSYKITSKTTDVIKIIFSPK